MEQGGAWQSEVFDNGRDFQHGPTRQGAQATQAPPSMYNPPGKAASKDAGVFGIVILSLRIAQIVFAIIGFSVMGANKIKGTYTSVDFTLVKGFVGLLSFDVIVCAYAVVQLVLSIVQYATKGTLISSPTTGSSMLTFVFDQVLAYGLIAAAAAAASVVNELRIGDACDGTNTDKYCQKAEASIAVSFIAFALLACSAVLYPVRLWRLSK